MRGHVEAAGHKPLGPVRLHATASSQLREAVYRSFGRQTRSRLINVRSMATVDADVLQAQYFIAELEQAAEVLVGDSVDRAT